MKKSFLKLISVMICIASVAALLLGGTNAAYGTAGDINRDGKINNKDVTLLFRHLNGDGVSVDKTACDTNGDGRITISDATEIQKYVAEYEIPYPIGKMVIV